MSKSHDRFSQHVGTLETITNLQQLLENLATTPACGLATVASPKSLASLRAAATFLGAAGSGDFHTVSEPAIIATVLSSAELAVQQLLEPSPELYSTVGGAPCQTPAELQIAGKYQRFDSGVAVTEQKGSHLASGCPASVVVHVPVFHSVHCNVQTCNRRTATYNKYHLLCCS